LRIDDNYLYVKNLSGAWTQLRLLALGGNDGEVRFDEAQSLTSPQKKQAQENILSVYETSENAVPVNAVAATGELTWGGSRILLTAATPGVTGNSISLTFGTPVDTTDTSVSVSGDAITVTPGSKALMTFTGTLTDGSGPVTHVDDLIYAGVSSGLNWWTNDGNPFSTSTTYAITCDPASGDSQLLKCVSGSITSQWNGSGTTTYFPDDSGLTWAPVSPATGTPTIGADQSSGAQVVYALQHYSGISGLVTVTSPSSGSPPELSTITLTGGTAPSDGVLRIYEGVLYVKDYLGVWAQASLSSLGGGGM
jgi:hypothetical protein